MKEEKNKVGRPRLADTSLKKNSIIMIEIAIIGIISLVIGGMLSLTGVKSNKLTGNIEDYAVTDITRLSGGVDYGSKFHFSVDVSFGSEIYAASVIMCDNPSFDSFGGNCKEESVTFTSKKNTIKNANFSFKDLSEDFLYRYNDTSGSGNFYLLVKTYENKRKFKKDEIAYEIAYEIGFTPGDGHKLNVKVNREIFTNSEKKVSIKKTTKSGWKKESGEWYYYKNGKKLTYLQKINGKYYYFNSKGEMQTGLIKYNKDGKYRYFFAVTNTKTNKTKGQMAINRKLKINGEPYEFDANGICIYGKRCGITTTKKITTKKATTSTRGELTLSCPSIAHVNEQFTCTTNMAGAKISVTASGLASGYNTSFTTTNSDRTKQSKYTTEGTKTITVSKSGYTSVTRQVKVKYKLQGGHGGHYTR